MTRASVQLAAMLDIFEVEAHEQNILVYYRLESLE